MLLFHIPSKKTLRHSRNVDDRNCQLRKREGKTFVVVNDFCAINA